jgi:hypothetical protein
MSPAQREVVDSSEHCAPKRRRYFFLRRFVVLRAVFLAADFVFDLAFFAMLPS